MKRRDIHELSEDMCKGHYLPEADLQLHEEEKDIHSSMRSWLVINGILPDSDGRYILL